MTSINSAHGYYALLQSLHSLQLNIMFNWNNPKHKSFKIFIETVKYVYFCAKK